MTHTYVELAVSARTYDEVATLLQEAGYGHAFMRHTEPPTIDMNGLALMRKSGLGAVSPGPTALRVTSRHTSFAVKTALLRAAFHLKKQGYGKDDVEMAEIIEQLDITVLEQT